MPQARDQCLSRPLGIAGMHGRAGSESQTPILAFIKLVEKQAQERTICGAWPVILSRVFCLSQPTKCEGSSQMPGCLPKVLLLYMKGSNAVVERCWTAGENEEERAISRQTVRTCES